MMNFIFNKVIKMKLIFFFALFFSSPFHFFPLLLLLPIKYELRRVWLGSEERYKRKNFNYSLSIVRKIKI